MLLRFAEDTFDPELPSIVGASYRQKHVRSKKDTLYQLEVWDTPGNERYFCNKCNLLRYSTVFVHYISTVYNFVLQLGEKRNMDPVFNLCSFYLIYKTVDCRNRPIYRPTDI